MRKHHRSPPVPPTPPLNRPFSPQKPLSLTQVRRLGELFGLLSSATRLRILHALARRGEMHVQAIADELRMKVAAVSNQLRLMAMLEVLRARSDGLKSLYSVADPTIVGILNVVARVAADSR